MSQTRVSSPSLPVTAGLVPAIHKPRCKLCGFLVAARIKSGHADFERIGKEIRPGGSER